LIQHANALAGNVVIEGKCTGAGPSGKGIMRCGKSLTLKRLHDPLLGFLDGFYWSCRSRIYSSYGVTISEDYVDEQQAVVF
jgi:hypothetical protein